MDPSDRPVEPALAIIELEARFEMEALPVLPGAHPGTDWTCTCSFNSA